MLKTFLPVLLIVALITAAAILTGCGKNPEVIMAAPLCDCNHNPEDPDGGCWEGYVCEPGAACSHDGGLYDKCIPEGYFNPGGSSY